MKALGQVPSLVGRDGAYGLARWTGEITTRPQVLHWAQDPRLGICVQTRRLRAIDVDVPDPVLAGRLLAAWGELTGIDPDLWPVRGRSNSGKCLLPFWCPVDDEVEEGPDVQLYKRRIAVEGGMVEWLATGQQFVAFGLHHSGVPYTWRGEMVCDGLPLQFPVLDRAAAIAAWEALALVYAVEVEKTPRGGARRRGADSDRPDSVADFLHAQGLVTGEGRDGQLFVPCPWEAEHSMDSGETATCWFPAGTGGYERGHFKCLHGHCEGRTDAEYLDAVGFSIADEFDDMTDSELTRLPAIEGEVQGADMSPAKLPRVSRGSKGVYAGLIEANINNLIAYACVAEGCGFDIGFDETLHDIVVRVPGGQWRELTDVDMVRMRARMERLGFAPIGREIMRDAVMEAAERNRFDSYAEWLEALVWDGVPRVAGFLQRYFGVADSDYAQAVSRYWWTAQAGRVLQPGIQADMVPVLVGEQGTHKTQAIKALVPTPRAYAAINLGASDDTLARTLRGITTGDIAELRGLRSRDAEGIKDWITRQEENWTPKYKERNTRFLRRCIFIGNVNENEFLDDLTGERRWLPVRVEQVADLPALARDRDQLWAEGRALFEAQGIAWQDAERLAKNEHGAFKVRDERAELVRDWLYAPDPVSGERPIDARCVRAADVAMGALGIAPAKFVRGEQMALARILRGLGMERAKFREGEGVFWGWISNVQNFAGSAAE